MQTEKKPTHFLPTFILLSFIRRSYRMALIKRICENPKCKKEFYAHECDIKRGHGRFCCKFCFEQTRKTNEYILHENYAELIINSKKYGKKILLIDLEDVERCKLKSWSISYDSKMKDFYFYAFVKQENGKRYSTSLHRYIMGEPKGLVIDHINTKDRLDNRKSNLRAVIQGVNCRNLNELKSKNGFQGVSFDKKRKKWKAYIGVNKRRINLGSFERYDDAVKTRKDAELRYWGKNKEKQVGKKELEFNSYLPIKNKFGYIGVYKRSYKKKQDMYIAVITVNWKSICLGEFFTIKEAVEARNKFIDDNNLSNRKNLYRGEVL